MSLIQSPGSMPQSPTASARTRTVRPPIGAVAVQILILFVAIVGFMVSGLSGELIVAVVAVFGSVLAFGIVRWLDDQRRASLGYADWSLASARSIAIWIMIVSWLIGLIHVYLAAIELTRQFNL